MALVLFALVSWPVPFFAGVPLHGTPVAANWAAGGVWLVLMLAVVRIYWVRKLKRA